MPETVIYQGTRDFAAAETFRASYCFCGKTKHRDAARCKDCHMDYLHNAVAIKAAARAKLQQFLEWKRARE